MSLPSLNKVITITITITKIIALIRDTPGDIAFFVHDILRYYHLTEVGDKTKP